MMPARGHLAWRRGWGGLSVMALALLAGAWCTPPAVAGLDASLERMMGKQAQSAIESEYRVVQDPLLQGFLQRLGDQVVAASGSKQKFTIKVIETEQVNALALPHGVIYVTTGLLRFADSPDELAGVISHEVGHVAKHHSLSSLKKQFWAGLGLGMLGLPQTAETAAQIGTSLAMLRYSRKDEGEADNLAVQYSLRAHYDPQGMAGFFRKLAAKQHQPAGLEVYLSTHPPTDRRISHLSELKELSPTNAAGRLAVGDGYYARGLYRLAAAAYRQAAESSPEMAAAHMALARALSAAGDAPAAAQAARRALELSPGEAAMSALVSEAEAAARPAAATVQAPRELLTKLAAARQARLQSAQALSQQQGELEDKEKELEAKTKAAGRGLAATSSRTPADASSARALRQAARVLSELDETTDRLRLAAKQLSEQAQVESDLVGKLEALLGQPQPQAKLELLQGWADRYVSDLSEENERSGQALRQTGEAAGAAHQAAGLLAEALESMQVGVGPSWRGTFLAAGSTMGKIEEAQRLAEKAAELTGAARKGQAAEQLRQWAYALNLGSLVLEGGERGYLDQVAAGFFGAKEERAAAARREGGGFGWGVLILAGAPGGELPAASAAPAPEQVRPQEQRPAAGWREEAVMMMVGLLKRQVDAELAAAGQPETAAQTGPGSDSSQGAADGGKR